MNCPFCGNEELVRIADMEGEYHCPACRHSFNDLVYRESITCSVSLPTHKSKCIICGFEEETLEGVFNIFVCHSCKDAIMRLKAMLGV